MTYLFLGSEQLQALRESRRGHVRNRLQGEVQAHRRVRRAEKDPSRGGGRRDSANESARDLRAQGTRPSKHRQAGRRDPREDESLSSV